MRRSLIPPAAFLTGSALMAIFYFGVLTWAQGWAYASSQFARDRAYVLPIILGFGLQLALYAILRFWLFAATGSIQGAGTFMSTSGAASATAMVACCIHHVTEIVPILGLSAVAGFLANFQRPFMVVGLAMNLVGIIAMLVVLARERQKLRPVLEAM